MSLFAAASGAADRTIDQVFADPILVTPRAAANNATGLAASQYRKAEADAGRAPFTIKTPIVFDDEVASTEGAQENRNFKGLLGASEIWIAVRTEALGAHVIREGDRIEALTRPADDRHFEVARVGTRDDSGRTRFYLTRVSP